jgi:hypothetical protein
VFAAVRVRTNLSAESAKKTNAPRITAAALESATTRTARFTVLAQTG